MFSLFSSIDRLAKSYEIRGLTADQICFDMNIVMSRHSPYIITSVIQHKLLVDLMDHVYVYYIYLTICSDYAGMGIIQTRKYYGHD